MAAAGGETGHGMGGVRQQNLESAVLFMQSEHANTLKALHEEIHHLQKRCSELTFQLAMETTSTSQEDFYRDKCETLERKFSEEEQTHADKMEELRRKEERILKLEVKMKAQEEGHRRALIKAESDNKHLRAELEKKADTIGTLMNQLHKLKKLEIHGGIRRLSTDPDQTAMIWGGESETYPSPAADPPPMMRARRHQRILQNAAIPRPPSSRRLDAIMPDTPPQTPPDAGVFLHASQADMMPPREHSTHSAYQPLPPIGASRDAGSVVRSLRRVRMPAGTERDGSPGGSSPEHEIEVLAIGQPVRRGHRFRPAHDSEA